MKTAQRRLAVLAAPIILGIFGCAGTGHRTATSAGGSPTAVPPEQMVAIARTFERQGHTDKAREIYASITAQHPTHAEAARRLQLIAARERQSQVRASTQSLLAQNEMANGRSAGSEFAQAAKPKVAPPVPEKHAVEPPALISDREVDAGPLAGGPEKESIAAASPPAAPAEAAPAVESMAENPFLVVESEQIAPPAAKPARVEETPTADGKIADAIAEATNEVAFVLVETAEPAAADTSASAELFERPTVVQTEVPQQNFDESDAFETPLEINPVRRVNDVSEGQSAAGYAPIVIVASKRAAGETSEAKPHPLKVQPDRATETLEEPSSTLEAQSDLQLISAIESTTSGIETLQGDASTPAVEALIEQLSSRQVAKRREAAVRLAEIGPAAQQAVPALQEVLHDSNLFVQAHAARALWDIAKRGDLALPVLADLLETGKPEVHALAAYVLGCMGEGAAESLPALGRVLESNDATARLHAAEAILKINPRDSNGADVLSEMLDSDDAEIRWLAAFSLAACDSTGAEDVVWQLVDALEDSDGRVQAAAALTLGSFGPTARGALDELATLSESEDSQVREAAVIAVSCIKAN